MSRWEVAASLSHGNGCRSTLGDTCNITALLTPVYVIFARTYSCSGKSKELSNNMSGPGPLTAAAREGEETGREH